MITRTLGLATVLALILAVSTPALAAKPIPGFPDFEITNKGNLIHQRDVILGNCDDVEDFSFPDESLNEQAARACEKAEHMTPLTDTGGPPIILVPIALLVAGGLLIRKSTAL
jgi:hypothetical protein